MADEILLPVKIDLASARHELEDFKQSFEGLKQTIDQAPNATNAFSQGLERAVDTADLLLQKINKAQQQTGLNEDNVFVQDIQAGLKELASLKNLFSDGGVFSTSLAKNMFSGLSEAARHELDASTSAIATMIRTKISTLKSTTLAGLSSEIMKSADAQSIFKDFKSVDSKDFRNYIQALLPHVAPTYTLSDYRKLRYGTDRRSSANSRPIDIIPSSFRQSYRNGGYVQYTAEHSGYMQPYFRTKLRDLVSENDAAMRAARATSGMTTHDSSGRTMFAHNITPKMYDEFRQNLFNDFINRASGRQSERINPFKELTQEEERRLLGRMTSSSAGRVLSAMGALESIDANKAWGGSGLGSGFQRLEKEVKQSLEQYEVAKYRFDDLFSGKDKHSNVTIAESQNTRLLGLQGKHNQFTDKVMLISANGYDRSDANQRDFMDRLLSGQAVSIPGSDKKYIMQNLHGTGEHSVIRMIEQQAYEEVRKREEQWAKDNGFTGTNYWNDFVDAAFNFEDIKALRKHYDATGKGWTPSQKLYSNFQDKKFGVVDLSRLSGDVKQKLADGLGWFADGILPINDIQGRMGVSGKGTFHTLKGYKTLGDFAAAVGLLNDQGRFILPGPRGDIDLTDYSGMTDISTLKNVQAYANFATPEAYNKGFTAMLQRYGMSAVQDYDSAETRGRGLGAQAMAYIKLSPEMQNAQINEYMRRMRLLDTEAGIREYLLGDPDNYLGSQVRNGSVSVGDRIVQNWVQAERESLIERMASGEWIDFGEQPSVVNQKVNKSPIASLVQMGIGKTREEVLNKIKQKYNLTDDEVEGIFALNKGQIVDFARPEERDVSVQRSPNGFGNFVYGRNYADIAKRVYNDHGLSTSGVYLSEADMLKLGDADFDGDAVKTLYGDIGKAFKEAAIMHDKAMASLGEVVDPITTPVKLDGINNYIDSTQHKRLALEANMDSGLAMGSSSSSGIRSTQFDLYNPANRDYLIAAIQSNPAYAATSAQAKNATETQITPEMRKALYEGAQWSKLPTRFSRFFNVTGNDDIDKPSIEDIFEADVNNKKEKVNLAELRDIGLDSINFRSIFSGADLGGARAAFEASKNGVDMTRAYALLQALDKGIGYGDAGENTVQLMKTLRQMKVQDIMNPGKILTREEVGRLEEMINAASDEIDRQYLDQGSSVVMRKKNEFGVTAARKFIERGIHEGNLSAYFGDGWKELFPEFYTTDREGVNIPGNESYKKFGVYDDAEQRLKENNARLEVIDREIKEREEKIQKIKDKLPEADRDKFDETLTKKEAVDVAKRIVAGTGGDAERVEAEAKEIERIYSDAEAFASEFGLDPNQVAADLRQLRQERSEKVSENVDLGKAYNFIKQQEKFYNARAMLKEFNSGLFSSRNSKEAKLDDISKSDSYYDRQMMLARVFLNPYKILQQDKSAYGQLSQDEKDEITTALSPDRGVIANVKREFADTAAIRAKNLFEKFDSQNAKHSEPEEILKRRFDQYDEMMQGIIEYRDKLVSIIDTEKNDNVKNDLQKRLNQANDYIKQAQEQINKVKESDAYNMQENTRRSIAQANIRNLQQQYQAERFETQSEQMLRNWNARNATNALSRNLLQRRSMYDQFRNERNTSELNIKQAQEKLDQAQSMLNNPQATSQQKLIAQKDIDSATASLEHYNNALKNAQEGMQQFGNKDGQYSEGLNSFKATIDTVSQSVDRLVQRFGRQIMQKAFNEAKTFVVQFDKQMRSIQTITMKTDEQMQAIKKSTVDRAIELKTSVANVAQVEADLYRQGLNDKQVEERASAIIKFATITGAKMTDAGKAITTAIQNGLVASAEEAMDVLVSLGDSAATTANEIFKGMQKSAAAAKVAGVSYDELTTLLTIGTSKTQLSGQVIGTGLQTIFSRMNRVTNKGYVDDETGASVSINDVEKALRSAGVQLREAGGRSFRNSFDVLRDLSRVWESLNDIQRNNITYTMAGGRQQNIFQSLMEGMAEDGGAEVERLLGLAENSEGAANNKYEIFVKSITSAVEELKSTYDGLIASLENDGSIVGVIESFTSFVNGLKNISDTSGKAAGGITLITSAVVGLGAALAMALSGAPGLLVALIGVLSGAGILGFASMAGQNKVEDPKVQAQQQIEKAGEYYNNNKQKRIEPIQKQIDEVRKLGEAYDKAKESDESFTPEKTADFESKLSKLSNTFSNLTGNINNNKTSIDDWKSVVEGVEGSIDKIDKTAAETADRIALKSFKITNPIDELTQLESKTKTPFTGFNGYVEESDLDWLMSLTQDLPENYRGLTAKSNINKVINKYGNVLSPTLLQLAKDFSDNIGIGRKFDEGQYKSIMSYLVNAIGIGFDPYSESIINAYDDFKGTKPYLQWINSFKDENKTMEVDTAESLAQALTYLEPNEINDFLHIFMQFTSENQQENSSYYSKQYDNERKERIANLLEVLTTDDIITGEDEVLKKGLANRLFEQTKHLSASELDDSVNTLLKYYSTLGNDDIKKMFYKDSDYNYSYRDENGNILFGFDDLDKAEEEYAKHYSDVSITDTDNKKINNINNQIAELQTALTRQVDELGSYETESELKQKISEKEKYISSLKIIAQNKKELYEAQKAQVDLLSESGEDIPESAGRTLAKMYQDWASAERDWYIEEDLLKWYTDRYDDVKARNLSVASISKNISNLLKERSEEEANLPSKTPSGFDILRIFNKSGSKVYQNLSEFVGDRDIAKQDYIDTYQKLLGYLAQNVDYSGAVGDINNVVEQLPNFAGVLDSDAELLKMLKSFENNDGKYNYQQLLEYVQKKTLGESISEAVSSVSSSAYEYNKQMSAINAIRSGNASSDQYDSIIKQYGITRSELEKNPELYLALENVRLQSSRNAFEQNAANYVSGWLKSYYNEDELKEMSGRNFDDIWQMFIDRMAKDNPNMASTLNNVMSLFKNAGHAFSINGEGAVSSVFTGKPISNNLLDEYDVKLTNSTLIEEYVNQLVSAGSEANKLFGELPEQIQQQLQGFAGLADYIKTYGQNTKEAAQAQKELSNAILEGTIKALEDEGKIITGLAPQLETIRYGNIIDSTKQINQLSSQIVEIADVQAAYNRLINGGVTRKEDWDLIQSFWGISNNDIEKYQTGRKNLTEDYGNRISELANVQSITGNTIAEEIIAAYAGENILKEEEVEPDNIFRRITNLLGITEPVKMKKRDVAGYLKNIDNSDVINLNKRLAPYGVQIKDGELVSSDISNQLLSFGQQLQATLDIRSALGQGNQMQDYRTMLNYYNIGGVNGLTRGIEAAQRVGGIFNTTAANDLLSNEEFVTAVQDNDINKIRNILLRGAYGVESPNSTRMNTAGVMDYISAILSGDKAKLYELSKPENKNIFDYLSGMPEFQEAYSSVMADLQLEKYQVDALRGASTYNELFERERNKELRAGTAQLGQTLVSGTDQERREALNAQVAQIQSLSKTSKTIDYLVEHQGESNEALWDELQNAVGLNDEQIEYYKKHTKELKNIQKDIDKDSTDIGEGLKAAIVSAFGLENFGDIVDEGKEDLKALVEAIFDLNGLNLNLENGEISANEKYASAGDALISTALDVSGYANEQEITTRRNAIADIVRNSQDVASFAQAFEEAAATNEWMKDSNILKQVLGTDMSKNLALANAGVINWEDFQNRIVQGTGYGSLIKDTSFEDYSSILERYTGENLGNIDAEGFTQFVSQFGETTGFTDWLKGIEGGEDVLREIGEAGSVSAETLKKFNANFDAAKIRDAKQWGDSTDAVADNVANLGKTAKSARETLRGMATQLSAVEKNQYYRQKYQGGDRSKETVGAIAGMIGMTEEDVKKGGSLIDEFLKAHEQDDIDSVNVWADTMSEMIADSLKGKVEDLPLDATQLDIIASGGSVNVDLSQVQAMLDSSVSEQLNSMIAMLEAKGFAYHIEATGGENGTVRVVVDNLGSGKKGGGGGGGGGGKSKAQKLMEELKREQQLRSHEIKMIQYQETKYENAGEIGNQNRMIELENIAQQKLIKSLETAIQRTKEQMAQTKKGSDDWYSLYESILSYEEGIEEANQAIADNTKKIKENQQAILKLRTDLEDTVNSEIEARKQRDRDMLAGSVNMQDTIIEAIRQRYRDEWELIEKDIDKKRQALEEEKNLIDERLQRRKDAEDEAEKYEELMEYKRQLALIEMDSTRTRDAAKLREKIADMEKDRAWKIAEDEAEYQKEQIDEQIQAYDDFITYGNEDLEDYLEDANNFADEVNGILQMNQEGIISWLKSNVKDYALAMDDAQKQMIQGWEDTYDEMLGITHTYWEEITAILSGKNLFLNYMKESQEYINASEAEQQQMLYGWSEAYDNWLAAQKNDAIYSHNDDELSGTGKAESKGNGNNNNNKLDKPLSLKDAGVLDDLKNVQWNDLQLNVVNIPTAAFDQNGIIDPIIKENKDLYDDFVKVVSNNATRNNSATLEELWSKRKTTAYASGGLVDYTGPAWVDGSPMKPEAFLDPEDTALMRSFLDEAKYVRYRSSISNIDSRSLSGNEQNIGELIINITEAQFKDDADFDEVARRVGDKFVKELSKQGFHTLSYSF